MITLEPLSTVASAVEIRRHFPALERTVAGQSVAYFDGPGGTQVPRVVGNAMLDYMYHHNANTHWNYPSSAETDQALMSARQAMADFVNATPDEIAFGANMTTLTFHISRALSREWGPGDEVVVTELDHHANVDPWQRLAAERGVIVHKAKMLADTGQLDWADLERLVTPRTRLLALGGASNALGTINDLPRAASLAHSVGALVFVDAVHYAPHALVDVRALDCDLLCCSAYKFYGPHIAMMYGRREVFEKIDFPKLLPAPSVVPEIAETGTLNHEGIVGAAAAVDFLASLGQGITRRTRLQVAFGELHQRGVDLLTQLWQGLSGIENVRLFGPDPSQPRTPTVAFIVAGLTSAEVSSYLSRKGLFLSHGDFYAQTVIDRLGQQPGGIVRAGCACYATSEEVDRLIAGVRELG
ncbi:MAG: cysteine desulfurase-like protein [Candidatus Sumerlaeaceae bacterium]